MKALWLTLAAVCITLTTSCGGHRKPTNSLLTSDDVHIAIDETFRPILEQEMSVFVAKYPEANMKPLYCSENTAIRLLLKDSIRMAITTRLLSKDEQQMLADHKLTILQKRIATDALALVVNKNSADTLITLDEIRGIVTGKITRWEQLRHSKKKGAIKLVFDNSGSSTVRYMKDSLCRNLPFKGNFFAQGTNEAVLETVTREPDMIGVVGANWLKGKEDATLVNFDNLPFKVMLVSRFSYPNEVFTQPFQYYIATAEYPLTRAVYVMSSDPRSSSMVKKFLYFLADISGQLIINKSSQMLTIMNVQAKDVNVKDQ